jgi:hypothetical protein
VKNTPAIEKAKKKKPGEEDYIHKEENKKEFSI